MMQPAALADGAGGDETMQRTRKPASKLPIGEASPSLPSSPEEDERHRKSNGSRTDEEVALGADQRATKADAGARLEHVEDRTKENERGEGKPVLKRRASILWRWEREDSGSVSGGADNRSDPRAEGKALEDTIASAERHVSFCHCREK